MLSPDEREALDLARSQGIVYVDLLESEIPHDLIKLLPENVANEGQVLPFAERDDGSLYVVVANPSDESLREQLQDVLNREVRFYVSAKSHIASAIRRYYSNNADD